MVRCVDCDRGNNGMKERSDGSHKEVSRCLYWPAECKRNNGEVRAPSIVEMT